MQPQTDGEYQKLLTDVIKKQIIILGPTITLAKARDVKGLTIEDDGTVSQISGSPKEITQNLVSEFMELSGLIVKKTMEPLLANYPSLAGKEMIKSATDVNPVQIINENKPANTNQEIQQPVNSQSSIKNNK